MNKEKNHDDFGLYSGILETIKKALAFLNAPSLDVISSRSFKDGTEVLSLPLCNLVNLSMKQSLIIDQYKIAKLMLQLKKKNALREPILSFPVVSKTIKSTIHIHVQEYLENNGLLYQYQSDFHA